MQIGLYQSYLAQPDIPELMKFTITSVEFSFDNIIYWQVDGILMGSVLCPTMARIFVAFYEVDLLSKYMAPEMYFCYVDDTFCALGSETEASEFFSRLNNMHLALRFTLEENNSILTFFDVLVCKETSILLTTVYRKPSFSGFYIHWDSFSPKSGRLI